MTEALQEGATAHIPTFAEDDGGAYVTPQILTNVNHQMRVMRDETFGPVVGIMSVKDDDEAIQLMNDSDFGLTASIWTQDTDAAEALGGRIQTGTVFMNRCDYLDPGLCWTGCKDTGRGASLSVLGYQARLVPNPITSNRRDPMKLVGNWSYPTTIRFGARRIAEIADACATAKIQKPLLVTDRVLANFDITQRTLDLLESAGLGRALFAEVDPNPNEKNLEEGLRVFREGGFDGVIAFGGGSGLDLAKLIAFMVGQTRPAWDFEDIGDWWTRANPDGIKLIIAVPTTAGTGSEVGVPAC